MSVQNDGMGAPSLVDVCVDALVKYRRFLGDVGYVEPGQLRRILAHCSRAELESVEDGTLEGSARDLTWFTWHLWYRIYTSRYSTPSPEELLPLPGDPPEDYTPPMGVTYTPAHYRAMIIGREAEEAARRAAAVNKLRAGYKAEAKQREQHGVEYTTKLPPAKRSRLLPAAAAQQKQYAASHAHKTLGGKPAVKVMNDLGLSKAVRLGVGKPLGSNPRPSGQSLHGMKSPGAKLAAARQAAAQPVSALACLAKQKSASHVSGGSSSGSSKQPAAAGLGRIGSQQTQKHQQQQGRQFQLSSSSTPPRPVVAARMQSAAAGGGGGGGGASRQQVGSKRSSAAAGLLDTPVLLSQAAAVAAGASHRKQPGVATPIGGSRAQQQRR